LFIGGLGGRGAVVSFKCLQHGDHNYWLSILTLLVGILIALEMAGGVWAAISWNVISSESADATESGFSETFQSELRNQLGNQPELWWDFQKGLECCGYENNTIPAQLATGKYCTTDEFTTAPGCKTKFWEEIGDNALPFGCFIGAFFMIQMAVCISSMCLACIIKAQEPIYRDS